MRICVVVSVMALFTGCSDGNNQGPGWATIIGTIQQQTPQPTTAFYMAHPILDIDVLVMPEAGEACATEASDVGLTTVIGFPCGAATATSYPVADPDMACGEAPYVAILVEGFDGELDEVVATAGTVTITSSAPSIVGTFTATIDGVPVTGTFDAIDCR
ncbi:MAG TPA: hypothetical protein VM513_20105 [Kofleriaceae bacterium]|nr:hypothetical protein [Kofleriaceae bacterium]